MKYCCMAFLLSYSLCINATAQVNGDAIKAYSKLLGKRNARLLECDSIAPGLASVYEEFIKVLMQYRNGIRDHISIGQMRTSYRLTKRNIYKLLDKKRRKRYRQLCKRTGNILLVD